MSKIILRLAMPILALTLVNCARSKSTPAKPPPAPPVVENSPNCSPELANAEQNANKLLDEYATKNTDKNLFDQTTQACATLKSKLPENWKGCQLSDGRFVSLERVFNGCNQLKAPVAQPAPAPAPAPTKPERNKPEEKHEAPLKQSLLTYPPQPQPVFSIDMPVLVKSKQNAGRIGSRPADGEAVVKFEDDYTRVTLSERIKTDDLIPAVQDPVQIKVCGASYPLSPGSMVVDQNNQVYLVKAIFPTDQVSANPMVQDEGLYSYFTWTHRLVPGSPKMVNVKDIRAVESEDCQAGTCAGQVLQPTDSARSEMTVTHSFCDGSVMGLLKTGRVVESEYLRPRSDYEEKPIEK
jgi:hypothetical protein